MRVCTFIGVLGGLAGVSAAVGAALLQRCALGVCLAALHACGGESTRSLRRGTVARLQRLSGAQELAARQALVVLLREPSLKSGADLRPARTASICLSVYIPHTSPDTGSPSGPMTPGMAPDTERGKREEEKTMSARLHIQKNITELDKRSLL